MRKHIVYLSITVVTFLLTASSFAQVQHGTITAGGGATANYSDGVFSASLSPSFGYFVSDHVSLGGFLSGSISSGELLRTFGVAAGPAVDVYFKNNFFVGVDASYRARQSTFDGSSSDSNFYSASARVGYSIFLSPNLALQPSLYATRVGFLEREDRPDTIRHDMGFRIGFTTYLNPFRSR